jgi:hypothetical protein
MNLTSLFLENNLPLSFFFKTFNLNEFDICCFNIYIYSINIFTLSSMVQEGLEVDIVENITMVYIYKH